jgi:hypothetical protein
MRAGIGESHHAAGVRQGREDLRIVLIENRLEEELPQFSVECEVDHQLDRFVSSLAGDLADAAVRRERRAVDLHRVILRCLCLAAAPRGVVSLAGRLDQSLPDGWIAQRLKLPLAGQRANGPPLVDGVEGQPGLERQHDVDLTAGRHPEHAAALLRGLPAAWRGRRIAPVTSPDTVSRLFTPRRPGSRRPDPADVRTVAGRSAPRAWLPGRSPPPAWDARPSAESA